MNDKKLAAYALYLTCYNIGLKYKDVRIANEMGISKEEWEKIHKEMELFAKHAINIPHQNAESALERVCLKRKIKKPEFKAMLEMINRIIKMGLAGGKKSTTIACFVFEKVMERSSTYNREGNKFDICDYITNNSMKEINGVKYWVQNRF